MSKCLHFVILFSDIKENITRVLKQHEICNAGYASKHSLGYTGISQGNM